MPDKKEILFINTGVAAGITALSPVEDLRLEVLALKPVLADILTAIAALNEKISNLKG